MTSIGKLHFSDEETTIKEVLTELHNRGLVSKEEIEEIIKEWR